MPEYFPPATLTSLNTIKHGCRSQQQLLPHEDPKAWMRLHDTYVVEFDPQTPFLQDLMEQAVRAHWFFRRNETNLYLVQADLPEDPRLWRPEDHHQIALFTRYQTAAERTFARALARLRSYHKDQQKSAQQKPRTDPQQPVKETKEAIKTKETNVEPVVIEQWVEVRRIDNKIVTQFFPSNEELEQQIETAKPKPDMVYRRLFFPDGVPQPYQWTRPRNGQAKNGGLAIQRMTVETWLSLRDKERETGLAESAGKVNLRDWRERDLG